MILQTRSISETKLIQRSSTSSGGIRDPISTLNFTHGSVPHLDFARVHQTWDIQKWEEIIFSEDKCTKMVLVGLTPMTNKSQMLDMTIVTSLAWLSPSYVILINSHLQSRISPLRSICQN